MFLNCLCVQHKNEVEWCIYLTLANLWRRWKRNSVIFPPPIWKFTLPTCPIWVPKARFLSEMLIQVGTMHIPSMKSVQRLGSKLHIDFNDFETQTPPPLAPPSFQKKRCNSWMWRLLLYNMVIFFMRCCVLRTLALSNWAHHAPWRSWASVKKDFRVISTPFTKVHPPHSPKVGATYESFIRNDAIGWYNVYMQYKVRVTR